MKSRVKVGDKYNKLEVLELVTRNKWGHLMWRCRCECGNETIVSSSSLTSLNTKSCGCVQKQRRMTFASLGTKGAKRNAAIAHSFLDVFQWRKMLFDLELTESERKALEKVRAEIIRRANEAIENV